MDLDFWKAVWLRALRDTFQLYGEGKMVILALSFLVTFFLKHHWHEVGASKKFAKDTAWGFLAATIVAFIMFIFHLFILSPTAIYEDQNANALQKQLDAKPTETDGLLIVNWRPPRMAWDVSGIQIVLGGILNSQMLIAQGASPIHFNIDDFRPSNKGQPIGGFPGVQVMTLHVVNNIAIIDVDVPTKGSLPLRIKNGESGQLPKGWDWNSNSNILEIVNDQLQVVLQEIYVVPNVILFRGAVQIGDQVYCYGYYVHPGIQNNEPHLTFNPDDIGLRRKFFYPAKDHKGEMVQD